MVQVVPNPDDQKKLIEWAHAGAGITIQSQSIGGHTGVNKTRDTLTSRFYWKGMSRDIEQFIHECDRCQRAKVINIQKARAQLQPIPVPPKIFAQVSIDLMQLYPIHGYK